MYKNRQKYLEAQFRCNEKRREYCRKISRKWRLDNKEKKKEYDKLYQRIYTQSFHADPIRKLKFYARRKLRYYVKKGVIKKLPCECGEKKVQAHHNDYNKPLEVVWLCITCHTKHHLNDKIK